MDFKKKTRTVWEIREAFYYLFSPETPQHSNPTCLFLKPLKLQNLDFSTVPRFSMYWKFAEYACKLQKIYPTLKNYWSTSLKHWNINEK